MTALRALLLWVALPGLAIAQTGVNDDRVSLPEGPGSLEGIGDNAQVAGNMGAMTYGVTLEVVKGFPGVTPALALDYSSLAGNSVVGMGFSFAQPFVERLTNRGLPRYSDEDPIVFGGDELVRVDAGEPALYRARFEKRFARYHWHARHAPDGGYWRVELPDGVQQWFGADPDGRALPGARVQGAEGVFRWQLVEARDRFGHRLRASYLQRDGLPYLQRLDYVYGVGPEPRASVSFDYERREDPIADARGGSEEVMTQRLVGVTASAAGVQFRRYALTYEPYDLSGGLSRLAQLEQFGLDDHPLPVGLQFSWSKALGGVCVEDCEDPQLVRMGAIGANPGAGNATLVDLDGDALPDIVDTSQPGPHRIFRSRMGAQGAHDFAPARESEAGRRAGHELASPYTQVLDANGDGRADMVNVRTGEVLYNLGTGDWAAPDALSTVEALPDFGEEFAVGSEELTHVRFFDYDNDRRIDVIRSSEVVTEIYANLGADGFALAEGVQRIGAGFDEQRLQLADLNGDGLLDPVLLRAGELSYRANLGFGRWSPWRNIGDLPFNEAQLESVELEDLNGDSLDDIVLVLADEVRFALNRGGERFDEAAAISETAQGALPQRVDGTSVLFADMNGSGSDDVVWITVDGEVTYLELFPLRPNLLTRIVDLHGLQTEVEYASAAQLRAEDPEPWSHTAPFAMAMVARLTTSDPLTELPEVTRFVYRDAFYDAEEKQFRGFAFVERRTAGDAHHQGTRQVERYELGVDDPYRSGRLLEREVFAEGEDAALQTARNAYADCEVEQVPEEALRPVRHICLIREDQVSLEGAPAEAHAATRTEYAYDAWGNRVLTVEHGVVSIGGAGCGQCDPDLHGRPCGPECLGDELHTERRFVPPSPGGPWINGLVWRERSWVVPGTDAYTETVTSYDGEPFLGLPPGEATLGLPTRVTERVDEDAVEPALRARYDLHGNLVEELDPVADLADPAGFRRRTAYDPTGLDIVAREFEVRADGEPYTLARAFEWHPVLGRMTSSSDWFVVGDEGQPGLARYGYDPLGRLTAIQLPGDAPETPTTTFVYDFEGPVSTVTRRDRSVRNSRLPDREHVRCFDSAGRKFQERVRLEPGRYQVLGHTVFGVRGQVALEHMDHVSDSRECALRPPEARAIANGYDALGRPSWVRLPDGDIHGTASMSRTTHAPLAQMTYDAEDLDPESPAFDTPTVRHLDGRGRTVALEYRLADGAASVTAFGYDEAGRLAAMRDPGGALRSQSFDGRGRVVSTRDPDRGPTWMQYDAAGRLLRVEDARHAVIRHAYDSLGRRIATWDEADPAASTATFVYDRPGDCPVDLCTHAAEALVEAHYTVAGVPVQAWYGYDDRRRLSTRRQLIGDAAIHTETVYDNLGEVLTEHFPGGISLEYGRDARSRPTSIEGLVDAIEYTDFSEVALRRFANGVVETHDFNGMRQAVRRQVETPAGPALLDLSYRYNRLGHVLEVGDALVDARDGPGLGARYGYDAMYRLVAAELEPDAPERAETLTYEYALDGRLMGRWSSRGEASPLHLGPYVYGEGGAGPHALTRAGALTLSYDAAGQLEQRGEVHFERDYTGRIVRATRAEDALATFGYTPSGRRMWRGEGAHFGWALGDGLEIEDGMLLVHALLGRQRLATIETDAVAPDFLPDGNGDGVIDAADAVLSEADETSRRRVLASSVRRALLEGRTRTTYYHYDHLFSAVALTDAEARLVEARAYAPYGAPRHVDSPAETSYGHSSQRADRSTGLSDYGARYYDAFLGRWAEPDPVFVAIDPGAVDAPIELADPYGYSLGNPVNYFDPDGGKADGATALKWGVKIGLVLGGSALGILTGGVTNVAAAAIGAAGAFAGAMAKEVAYYKVGHVKATPTNLALSGLRVLGRTAGGFLAGGFLGVGWAAGEWVRAAVGAGVAYKSARTRDTNGLGTPATTKWDLAGLAVDLTTPSITTPALAVGAAAVGAYTYLAHKRRKARARLKVRRARRQRGLHANGGGAVEVGVSETSRSKALVRKTKTIPSRRNTRVRVFRARVAAPPGKSRARD